MGNYGPWRLEGKWGAFPALALILEIIPNSEDTSAHNQSSRPFTLVGGQILANTNL